LLAGLTVLTVGAMAPAFAGVIDNELQAILTAAPADQPISTWVYLTDRVDLAQLNSDFEAVQASLQARHETVVRSLRAKAEATEGDIVEYSSACKTAGGGWLLPRKAPYPVREPLKPEKELSCRIRL
jgi:hypothetical protein